MNKWVEGGWEGGGGCDLNREKLNLRVDAGKDESFCYDYLFASGCKVARYATDRKEDHMCVMVHILYMDICMFIYIHRYRYR